MNIIPDLRILAVQAGGFLLVLLFFKFFLFKPIMEILDARRREISGEYDAAAADRKSASEIKADYERHIAGVEEEMRAKLADAVKEGQAMREEIMADARAQAEQILAKAAEEISRERNSAMLELKTTVANLAVDAAGKLIDEKLDDPKHRQLIDKFIDNLDEAAK